VLRGRCRECEVLDRLLEALRGGQSGALVLRGESGIGKTELLEYALDSASDLRVLRAVGVESEMELTFAALHQLCAPLLDRLPRLPDPQREALGAAFGLSSGGVPDRFLVGLAVLGLLSDVAEERPVLCVVDDAQWLDRTSAQALAFVARRLLAESVAVIFGTREPSEELGGLPELEVQGLGDRDARELLGSVVRGPLDERVRERIVAETRGNPLALLELPRGLTPAELAGGFGLPDALALPGQIEENFKRRLDALPREPRTLLLVAAAEPVGDPALVWRAAERLGNPDEASAAAEAAGLLEVGAGLRFRHPLVRSAVYRAASPGERREAHRALADVTDPQVDADRRAWHRAQATPGPDDDVAAELERSAGRAQGRAGLAAAAAFLERAVALTRDPARRAQRALEAARAKHLAGAPDAAEELLGIAVAGPLDELGRARADLLRGQMAFPASPGSDAPRLLLGAAKRLEPLDIGLARETYMEALFAAQFAGRLAPGSLLDAAQAARRAQPAAENPSAYDLLLDGLATRFTEGYAAGAPTLKRALSAFPGESVAGGEELRWLWLAGYAAVDLWDDEMWDRLASRQVRVSRGTGALAALPLALVQRIAAHTFAGELAAAASLNEELEVATDAMGIHLPPYGALLLSAVRGDEAKTLELIDTTRKEALARGEGIGLTIADWASAVFNNGLGQYEDALAAAEQASEHPEDLGFSNWGLVESVVAAVRSGMPERASDAVARLSDITLASGTDWAVGIEARSRALVSEGDAADRLYREAIERLSSTRIRVDLARAHLLYGEWLRRERRRVDAREQLRIAEEMLAGMGIEAFTSRTSRELLATGERARRRVDETRDHLTAQEAQVARLARDGLSNPEIGARLFISPRTVEYHLHKVFTKLGISSRNQLDRVLPREPSAPETG
jgi:DNA-binding CsgD family transcriptional regulator